MKVLPINNTSFKAALCTNYEENQKGVSKLYSRFNYWPYFIDNFRKAPSFNEFENVLTKVCNKNQDDVVLALERIRHSDNYVLAAYKNDNDVLEDRATTGVVFSTSVNKSGIVLRKMFERGRLTTVEMELPNGTTKFFDDFFKAVKFALENFVHNNKSDIYESLMSEKYIPAKEYLKRFAQKVAK